jgi:hypothetical protein
MTYHDDTFRRTLNFKGARKADLQTIKSHTGKTTDTAAVDDAIQFRARYAECDPKDLDLGLWLINEIKKAGSGTTRTIIVEDSSTPNKVTKLAVPTLG